MSTLIVTNIETQNAQVQNINGGQLAGMRNKIINGKMEIAQRGTSFPSIVQGAYSLDRWVIGGNSTAAVLTASQVSDGPPGEAFQNSLHLTVTTADATIAATDGCTLNQRIEGYNVRDLILKTFTLSFWVRSSKTGVHCVSFLNSIADRSYVAEYVISAANTWEYKSIIVSGGLPFAGTWNWTNGIGLNVRWALAAGSNFHTTAGSWQTGNFSATANQVNCLDTVGNIFALTGVQLEVGEVATPFEHRPYGTELALCQRYYQVAYTGGYRKYVANVIRESVPLAVVMRAAPTLTKNRTSVTGLQTDSTNASAAHITIDLQYTSGGTGVIDIGSYEILANAEL